MPTTAFTLEYIGWHFFPQLAGYLPEYCAESCGGVKMEGRKAASMPRKMGLDSVV